ncbi:hypothetical protein [Limosilactobacillus coleohominis]|uniref:NrS-1 polymerase-like HBD domain-containing protein n=1 Tax=Limosilactobacillus coleohominis TaxID=181675 RepID=A0ABS2GV67_9LACO|nr:hypothetical protein [Limosilactobacillus coleohominis]MBM6940172.1 hypothetical protein [Limosilactobacillus coleohominis]
MTVYLPSEMGRFNRWGLWKRVVNSDRINKIPWNPIQGQNAKSNDPSTWCSFNEVRQTYHAQPNQYGGPAYFLGDSWCLLDLDDITDTIAEHKLGEVNLIDQILFLLDNTYCEVSTSQSGLHFIFRIDDSVTNFGQYKKVKDEYTNNKSRELYHDKRFVALTGNCLNDETSHITTIGQERWSQLYQLVFGQELEQKANVDAKPVQIKHHQQLSPAAKRIMQAILDSNTGDNKRLRNWLDVPVFDSTREAQAHKVFDFDHSAEDQSCCNMLAYWTRCDPQLMDEIFRQTQLYRPKWDRQTGTFTYGDITIQNAINYKSAQFNSWKKRQPKIIVKGVIE